MKLRMCAATAALVTVSACATPQAPPATPPGQGFSASAGTEPDAREKKILDYLSGGDVAPAKAEAQALVAERPDDREAGLLLMEIEQDPRTLLGALSFGVTAKEGDTFAGLSERYLHDRGLAYALARYNGVTPPTQPVVGQTVQIPGSPAQAPRGSAAPPRRREPAPARTSRPAAATEKPPAVKPASEAPSAPAAKPAAASKPAGAAHDPAKAAGLRSDALVLMNKGDIDHAVGLLRQAAALDPDSDPIKADLDRALRIQHGAH